MDTGISGIRPARRDDANVLAELVNHAGEGLPLHLWGRMALGGETAWEVGRARAARDEGSFSWRNATMIERDGRAAGCLIGYGIDEDPAPVPADMPEMFVPLQELENLAPATWYVNVLAVLPEFRRLGLGSALLRMAETVGRSEAKSGTSLIVSDANSGARRLYARHGYRETAHRTMVKEDWRGAGRRWVLMVKEV